MKTLSLLIFLSGIVPLIVAWNRQRGTSLIHAMGWVMLAWLGWAIVLVQAAGTTSPLTAGRYTGVCLIVCAGVAVLGARSPRAGAWNFVVLGLLPVLMLPWMEGFLTGVDVQLSDVRAAFLFGAILLLVVNYLGTALGPAALLVGLGCDLELASLLRDIGVQRMFGDWNVIVGLTFGMAPWIAWLALRRRSAAASAVDVVWLDFRDRYGLAWAQLVREQFNRAVANAGYPVELGWSGLRTAGDTCRPDPAMQESCRAILESLLKRFGLRGTEAE